MDTAERAIAYRKALGGRGRDVEVELARICAGLHGSVDAAAAWEGALLAEVSPSRLQAAVDAEDWPAVAALADLAGEDAWSAVVRYNRGAWNR